MNIRRPHPRRGGGRCEEDRTKELLRCHALERSLLLEGYLWSIIPLGGGAGDDDDASSSNGGGRDGAGDGQLRRGLSGVDLGLGFGIGGAFVDVFPRIFNAQVILRRQCLELPVDGQAAMNTGSDAAFGDGGRRKER
jgi:hypothetical protein